MTRKWLLMVVAIATIGLSACGVEDGRSATTDAAAETPASQPAPPAPSSGDAILIETHIRDARQHVGEVLDSSVIGESPFCPGGESSGSSRGAIITATFHCAEGTLTVEYAPTQRSLVQGAQWVIVSGTGSFEGVRGGGSMVAAFESDDPDSGREVFTGTVTP